MTMGRVPQGEQMNPVEHNRWAWDRQVEEGNQWTLPVTSEQVAAAREGRWEVFLTPAKPVPGAWFGEVRGKDLLLLASGGGQQGPLLAAAGARITVFDNSPRQLGQDRMVAERDGLEIRTVLGDMRDLSAFAAGAFDLIFHPVSNCFAPEIRPVWREAFRVLRPGGALLAGFMNPVIYTFDQELERQGTYTMRRSIPCCDLETYSEEERNRLFGEHTPLEWSHSLDDQIGGQIEAGFLLAGFYEDTEAGWKLSEYFPPYLATRAVKPLPTGTG